MMPELEAMVCLAIGVMDFRSREVGVNGRRIWSDEDSWRIEVDDAECITVDIGRTERHYTCTWYVPNLENEAEFRRELNDLLAEVFRD